MKTLRRSIYLCQCWCKW